VLKDLARSGAVGPRLRSAALRKLEEELTRRAVASSPRFEAAAAFVGALLELLPEPPERKAA
jgi:hypothetical protein